MHLYVLGPPVQSKNLCMHVRAYTYMYGCECTCGAHMCACVYVCVHECMRVYLCVQVCMCVGEIFSVSVGGGQNLLVYCVLGGHDL